MASPGCCPPPVAAAAGVTSALAYALGAICPFVIAYYLPVDIEIWVIALAVRDHAHPHLDDRRPRWPYGPSPHPAALACGRRRHHHHQLSCRPDRLLKAILRSPLPRGVRLFCRRLRREASGRRDLLACEAAPTCAMVTPLAITVRTGDCTADLSSWPQRFPAAAAAPAAARVPARERGRRPLPPSAPSFPAWLACALLGVLGAVLIRVVLHPARHR